MESTTCESGSSGFEVATGVAENDSKSTASTASDETTSQHTAETEDPTTVVTRYYELSSTSNAIFAVASFLYLALSVSDFHCYQYYKNRNIPLDIQYANDDVKWWQYYNETGQIPTSVNDADDDKVRNEWFHSTFYYDRVGIITYSITSFFAAFGFLLTGIIEIKLAKGMWYTALYSLMILAASLGIASAILTELNPFWSNILNTVSVHLFAMEGVSLVFGGRNGGKDDYYLGRKGAILMKLGDLSFMFGTCGDVVWSYFDIFKIGSVDEGIGGIVTACFWLLCALLYLGVDCAEAWFWYHDEKADDNIKGGNENDIEAKCLLTSTEPTCE
jgi:hypothetical protein